MRLVAGEHVTVKLKDGREFSGLVLPNHTLKLDDGYNIGIDPESVVDVKTNSQRPSQKSLPEVQIDDSLPRVDILHTGGTIASKVDYETGGVHNHIRPEELLAMYPELQDHAAVHASFVANMSSDDMRFAHYNMLIDAVHKSLENKPSGIIITHGTDTLHYSAAALHYALRGIDVPVVLVGSQRSSDRGSSDAATNLLSAVRYCASDKAQPGVFVAMHHSSDDSQIAILPGVHCRKMHTSRRDAFKAINTTPVAVVADSIDVLRQAPVSEEPLEMMHYDEDLKIGMLYSHPNMFSEEISCYQDFDALVVLGTGLGHLPVTAYDEHTQEHAQVFDALKALKLPVVMGSQCIHGRVNLQVYSPARRLAQVGVLGHDLALTPETLFIKTAYLLSTGQDLSFIGADLGDVIERTSEVSYE